LVVGHVAAFWMVVVDGLLFFGLVLGLVLGIVVVVVVVFVVVVS